MLPTTLRARYAVRGFRCGQMTFLLNAEDSRIDRARGRTMDDRDEKHQRDPEDRVIDDCNEQQREDKAMDKTLADSFPASDPPAWQSTHSFSRPLWISCRGE